MSSLHRQLSPNEILHLDCKVITDTIIDEIRVAKWLYGQRNDTSSDLEKISSEIVAVVVEHSHNEEKSASVMKTHYKAAIDILNIMCDRLADKGYINKPNVSDMDLRGVMVVTKFLTPELCIELENIGKKIEE